MPKADPDFGVHRVAQPRQNSNPRSARNLGYVAKLHVDDFGQDLTFVRDAPNNRLLAKRQNRRQDPQGTCGDIVRRDVGSPVSEIARPSGGIVSGFALARTAKCARTAGRCPEGRTCRP